MTSFSRGGTAALAAVLLAAPVTGAQIVAARDTPRFYGTWRLVSETQTGMMIYDSLGNMAAQVMPNRLRRKYAAAEPTPEEAKAAITGYLAYFGTYTVDEQAHIITHHRKGNINPCRKYEQDCVGARAITHLAALIRSTSFSLSQMFSMNSVSGRSLNQRGLLVHALVNVFGSSTVTRSSSEPKFGRRNRSVR
jgi:hypothetical protein